MAERAGHGVRIAVIDSGAHPGHPHIDAAQLARGVAVDRAGSIDAGEGATLDRIGHGTAVAAAIQQWAPGAVMLPVRVFGTALRASPRAVIAAIDWCIEEGVDLVNLSLGTTGTAHEPVFAAAVARAGEAGTLLVSARTAGGCASIPGCLAGTIGVDLDPGVSRNGWRLSDDPRHRGGAGAVFLASGEPRPIPGVVPNRNLGGISFAVANITGFAAAALARHATTCSVTTKGRERLATVCALLSATAPLPAGAGVPAA